MEAEATSLDPLRLRSRAGKFREPFGEISAVGCLYTMRDVRPAHSLWCRCSISDLTAQALLTQGIES